MAVCWSRTKNLLRCIYFYGTSQVLYRKSSMVNRAQWKFCCNLPVIYHKTATVNCHFAEVLFTICRFTEDHFPQNGSLLLQTSAQRQNTTTKLPHYGSFTRRIDVYVHFVRLLYVSLKWCGKRTAVFRQKIFRFVEVAWQNFRYTEVVNGSFAVNYR